MHRKPVLLLDTACNNLCRFHKIQKSPETRRLVDTIFEKTVNLGQIQKPVQLQVRDPGTYIGINYHRPLLITLWAGFEDRDPGFMTGINLPLSG